MKRLVLLIVALGLVGLPAYAQTEYPDEVLERYWECMERNDLDYIKELLYYHHNVERIDASVYGLPADDFDDRALLTINERLAHRQEQDTLYEAGKRAVPMATTGPLQYPHHLRAALDNYYETTGERFDCTKLLEGEGIPADLTEPIGAAWSSDLNLTSGDSADRGEVDIAIDFANPNRIMASSCPSGGAETSNFIAYTDDWGQTWNTTQVGNNSGTSWECDPVSYYQRSTGRVYHSKIGCSNGYCSNTYTLMRYSSNNGASWSDCGRPANQNSEDRQWHVVDNNPASACYGNIYATWHNSNQQRVATSTDDCASWTSLTNLTGTYQAITPDINVAADGHVYVVWQNHGDSTFKIAGSDDCGASWTAPSPKTLTSRNGDWSNNLPAQCQRGVASQPWVDVDRSPDSPFYGRVYVGLAMFSGSCSTAAGYSCSQWDSNWTNTCNYDFFLMYSDNNGATWSSPQNLTSGDGNRVDHLVGYMRVDEADGSIYIGYHRSRLNPSTAADRQKTHFFVQRSIDGGASWEPAVQVSHYEGNERLSGASSFERGDYHSIDVKDGVAWPVWIDRRGGSGEEEVIVRKVCSSPAHWSERSPSFTAPGTTCSDGGGGTVDVSWTAPDIYWGDAGETTSARKYQLWVDGSLAVDNINWTTTSVNYDPGDAANHTYFVRAVNQCGLSKDYASTTFAATGGCANNPTSVSVTPNGPLSLCDGTSQTLTATASGGAGLSYQWTRNGSPISGATSSTYNATISGSYNCVVTGSECTSGVQDSQATDITFSSEPDFAGATSAAPMAGTCGIRLDWDPATPLCSTGVSYNVYRSTSSGFSPGAGTMIASCVGDEFYEDTSGLSSGVTYHYIVRAEDGASGAGGPCNGGNEDGNFVEVSTSVSGGSQTLMDDDFSSGAAWSVSTGPGPHTCGEWALSTSSNQRPPNSVGNYALTDSDACGSGSQTSTILTSDVMNAAGFTSLTLEFDMYYRYYNGDDTTVQVFDGSSWVTVWADSNANDSSHKTIDVSAYANADFQVRFSYQNAAWDWWFAVDNVQVYGEGGAVCP